MAATNSTVRNYQDLHVWQKARLLAKRVYEVTDALPAHEQYGLTQQLRRAAVSIPSNIAEGYGRGGRQDYVRFLKTARGSLYELQTQLLLAQDFGYLSEQQVAAVMQHAAQCSQVLHGLIRSLVKPKVGK